MGNIVTNRNRVIPSDMVPINQHISILKKLQKAIILLKKTNEELEKYKNPTFECCVCYDRNHKNQKKTRCNHPICKTCFNSVQDKRCPLCRNPMVKKRRSRYSVYTRQYH